MASTSRYVSAPVAGGASAAGILEALNRVLADLSTRGYPKVRVFVCFKSCILLCFFGFVSRIFRVLYSWEV